MNSTSFFPRSAPEAQGVFSEPLAKFVRTIRDISFVHSFMLLRHGTVIAEGWSDPYSPEYFHRLYSTTKSFTSTAIGFAISERLLALDDKIVSFFPEYDSLNLSDAMKKVTVRHLLSMTSGHACCTLNEYMDNMNDPSRRHKDWVKAYLESPLQFEPGTRFVYNSGNSYMLSAIIHKVSEFTLAEYLTPRLFKPLGITPGFFQKCPMHNDIGGWGLELRTEDMAKFGQLLLQKGCWNGKQILPWNYFEMATVKQSDNSMNDAPDWKQGYGFHFWHNQHNTFRADGWSGQFIVVMPEQDMVFVSTGGYSDMQCVLDALWDNVLPAVTNAQIADRFCAEAELRSQCKAMRIPLSCGDLDKRGQDAVYVFDSNDLKFRSVSVKFLPDACEFVFQTSNGPEKLSAGFGFWKFSFLRFDDYKTSCAAASAAWTPAGELELTVCRLETPSINHFFFTFEGDKLALRENTAFKFRGFPWPILNASKKE